MDDVDFVHEDVRNVARDPTPLYHGPILVLPDDDSPGDNVGMIDLQDIVVGVEEAVLEQCAFV